MTWLPSSLNRPTPKPDHLTSRIMFLSVDQGNHNVNLTDGNGRRINNCIEIETDTGEALIFMDLGRPETWPEHWKFGQFIGSGGGMRVNATFKMPITVTMRSGVVVADPLQLAVASRFESLGLKLNSMARHQKTQIDNAFIDLWMRLGRAKAGIFRD
jgi:hypothetical protein